MMLAERGRAREKEKRRREKEREGEHARKAAGQVAPTARCITCLAGKVRTRRLSTSSEPLRVSISKATSPLPLLAPAAAATPPAALVFFAFLPLPSEPPFGELPLAPTPVGEVEVATPLAEEPLPPALEEEAALDEEAALGLLPFGGSPAEGGSPPLAVAPAAAAAAAEASSSKAICRSSASSRSINLAERRASVRAVISPSSAVTSMATSPSRAVHAGTTTHASSSSAPSAPSSSSLSVPALTSMGGGRGGGSGATTDGTGGTGGVVGTVVAGAMPRKEASPASDASKRLRDSVRAAVRGVNTTASSPLEVSERKAPLAIAERQCSVRGVKLASVRGVKMRPPLAPLDAATAEARLASAASLSCLTASAFVVA